MNWGLAFTRINAKENIIESLLGIGFKSEEYAREVFNRISCEFTENKGDPDMVIDLVDEYDNIIDDFSITSSQGETIARLLGYRLEPSLTEEKSKNTSQQNRILVSADILSKIMHGPCPVCREDTLILDKGDYLSRFYCLNCDEFDFEILHYDESNRRHGNKGIAGNVLS